jgi:hypothetical protein
MAAIGTATPNTGKTNIRWARLIVDTVDLSGDTRQIGSFGLQHQTSDITGYADAVHYISMGRAEHIFNGYQAVLNNTATTGSHIELSAQEEYIVSFCIGVKAAPEVGSKAWLSSMQQVSYDVSGNGTLISVDFAKAITDADHTVCFGDVLEAGTARTATITGEGIDNLEASTNGFVAHLHVVASDGGTWAFDIETSSDDGDLDPYASVATFTADGTALAAERIDVAGAVERYMRVVGTRTSGNVTFWCTVARGHDL